ncbi:MAG: hypothetical protein GXP45_06250 [bacterium]|nr:hypothetical protein [bacterium]
MAGELGISVTTVNR